MIISSNSEAEYVEFNELLDLSVQELNAHAKRASKKIEILKGNKLEPYVRDIMSELSMGTSFENSIELIGGQKFPDIVAKKFYGVEVKTTTKDHWKTTGNSVLESTRVDSVERIFMLFGKLASPIEFRYKPYEECLAAVVVTHSPRYQIDMNLERGHTIFDKMKIPYDKLREENNPILPIIEYYRSNLKKGDDLWWLDQEGGKSNSFIIRLLNNLSKVEKDSLRMKSMIYFPEIFGNTRLKYLRVASWLASNEGVVCANVRDLFSSGGQGILTNKDEIYRNVPQIIIQLIENLPAIKKTLSIIPATELNKYWEQKTIEKNKLKVWSRQVSMEIEKTYKNPEFKIDSFLAD